LALGPVQAGQARETCDGAAPHPAHLLTNREDGIKFDQIFITPWREDEFDRRVPQGIE